MNDELADHETPWIELLTKAEEPIASRAVKYMVIAMVIALLSGWRRGCGLSR